MGWRGGARRRIWPGYSLLGLRPRGARLALGRLLTGGPFAAPALLGDCTRCAAHGGGGRRAGGRPISGGDRPGPAAFLPLALLRLALAFALLWLPLLAFALLWLPLLPLALLWLPLLPLALLRLPLLPLALFPFAAIAVAPVTVAPVTFALPAVSARHDRRTDARVAAPSAAARPVRCVAGGAMRRGGNDVVAVTSPARPADIRFLAGQPIGRSGAAGRSNSSGTDRSGRRSSGRSSPASRCAD
jgi:hypothetical protein